MERLFLAASLDYWFRCAQRFAWSLVGHCCLGIMGASHSNSRHQGGSGREAATWNKPSRHTCSCCGLDGACRLTPDELFYLIIR